MIKNFLVQDRNDPTKKVEVVRYILASKEQPTGVVWGKFSPYTSKGGHGRLVELAKKEFGEENVIIASPKRKGNDPKVDIFTDEQKAKIINKAEPNIKFIRIDNAFPPRAFSELVKKGITRPVLIIGEDREEEFSKYFIKYDINNKGTEDIDNKDFGKGEFLVVSRKSSDTSASKVRKALLDNDKETFLKLTRYDNNNMWEMMRQMLKDNKVIKDSLQFQKFYFKEDLTI
jgi:nicotinic acid mononucleotide adenylyltransferase